MTGTVQFLYYMYKQTIAVVLSNKRDKCSVYCTIIIIMSYNMALATIDNNKKQNKQ